MSTLHSHPRSIPPEYLESFSGSPRDDIDRILNPEIGPEINVECLGMTESDYRHEEFHQPITFRDEMQRRLRTHLSLSGLLPEKTEAMMVQSDDLIAMAREQWNQEHKAKYCKETAKMLADSVRMQVRLTEEDFRNESLHGTGLMDKLRADAMRAMSVMGMQTPEMTEGVMELLSEWLAEQQTLWTNEHTAKYCKETAKSLAEAVRSAVRLTEEDFRNEAYHKESTFMQMMRERAVGLIGSLTPEMRGAVMEMLSGFFAEQRAVWQDEHSKKYCKETAKGLAEGVKMSVRLSEGDHKNGSLKNPAAFRAHIKRQYISILAGQTPEMIEAVEQLIESFINELHREWERAFNALAEQAKQKALEELRKQEELRKAEELKKTEEQKAAELKLAEEKAEREMAERVEREAREVKEKAEKEAAAEQEKIEAENAVKENPPPTTASVIAAVATPSTPDMETPTPADTNTATDQTSDSTESSEAENVDSGSADSANADSAETKEGTTDTGHSAEIGLDVSADIETAAAPAVLASMVLSKTKDKDDTGETNVTMKTNVGEAETETSKSN